MKNKYKNHYTYLIVNIYDYFPQKYIGTRSTNLDPLSDLGVIYFSSFTEEEFITEQKQYPERFEYYILDNFNTRDEATELEVELHALYDVKNNDSYYNKANQTSTGFDTTGKSPWNKGLHTSLDQIEKIKVWCKKEDIHGISNASKRSLKAAETCRTKIMDDGRTKIEHINDNHRKTVSKIESNGKTKAYNIAMKGIKTQQNTILENGLTIEQNKVIKRSKTVKKDPMRCGKGKIINIYNFCDKLMFESFANFQTICVENNLPFLALRRSYLTDTKIKWNKKCKWDKLKFNGWYAVEL